MITVHGIYSVTFHDKHNVLHICTFPSMHEVPSMAVFCTFLKSRLPGISFRHSLNNFEMVPDAPVITGITYSTWTVLLLYGLYVLNFLQLLSLLSHSYLLISQCLLTDTFLSITADFEVRFIVRDGSVQ